MCVLSQKVFIFTLFLQFYMSKEINIVGAGFTGLTMGYYLSKAGWKVKIFEKDETPGGLAGSYKIDNQYLEKFYHHWFTNDMEVQELVKEVGLEDNLVVRPSNNSMYFANNFFKLSSPLDLLKFKPIPFFSRIRLGMVVLMVKIIKNWQTLENITAKDWLTKICGEKGYKVVWEPLLKGKFGKFYDKVSAVWFWNKLKLRGGSRGKKGKENLLYIKGGFGTLLDKLIEEIINKGGEIHYQSSVVELNESKLIVKNSNNEIEEYLNPMTVLTIPLPVAANVLKKSVDEKYFKTLNQVTYLGNICMTMELTKSLSEIYWLNVNDPGFPFVGVIEHTNFEPKESYGGRHIVYLSKYLPTDEALYAMNSKEFYNYAIPFIKRMFPKFDESWVINCHVWKEEYSQPLVTLNYSKSVPPINTPLPNVLINTMAQIYPEDRGTNYAVREGKRVADEIIKGNTNIKLCFEQ